MIGLILRAALPMLGVSTLAAAAAITLGLAFPGQMVAGAFFDEDGGQRLAFYDVRTAWMHLRLEDTHVGTLPIWSPDGTELAYASTVDGDSELFVVPTFSGTPQQITHNREFDNQPVYSNDGTQIAFVSNRAGHFNLYSMSSAGHNVRRLTYGAMDDYYPAWSPDNRLLVFVSWMTGSSDLYVMDVTARDPARLTSGLSHETYPVWSPDGRKIAYVAETNSGSDIFLTDPASHIPQQITRTGLLERSLAWAQDSDWIYYAGFDPGEDLPRLYRVSVTTGSIEQLSGRVPFPAGVAWKP